MATLPRLPPVQPFSSNKLFPTPRPIFHHGLYCYSHDLPRVCASLTKKSRASRKGKSDEDLRNDIKEFLSTVGLPQDHVPSTKELSHNGRQDLANIVRRRGYKFIRELLATPLRLQGEEVKDFADNISLSSQSTEVERLPDGLVEDVLLSSEAMNDEENMKYLADDIYFSSETTEVERQTADLAEDVLSSEATNDEENMNNSTDDISLSSEATKVERQTEDLAEDMSQSSETTKDEENMNDFTDSISWPSEATEVERQTEDLSEDVSLPGEAAKDEEIMINWADNVSLPGEATISKGNVTSAEMIRELKPDDHSNTGPYSSSSPSLEEKVAKFVQEGELDEIEDSGFERLKKSPSADSTEFTKSQEAIESESDSVHGAHEDLAFSGPGGSDLSKGYITLSQQPVEYPSWETNASRAEILSNEKVMVVNQNEDRDIEQDQKADSRAEISRLKYMLHQKELELTKLKEQIEKEKLALSILQTKAEKEISEAQKLISEKDAELHAAEDSLAGLKEVEIQYWGEGELIEIAGSFNGWHQRIEMDPVVSSSISDLTGSRKSRLWRTVLWLYPGVYEIKFIADGHWTIDPQRESVTRGSIHNNILRVDR